MIEFYFGVKPSTIDEVAEYEAKLDYILEVGATQLQFKTKAG